MRSVQPVAKALLSTMAQLSRVSDEINIEFAVELSAQAGAIIASLGTGANFKVSLTWKPEGAALCT